MQRSVIETISQMIPVIQNEDLRRELQAIKDETFMELPESNIHLWSKTAKVLGKYIVGNDNDLCQWENDVFAIWQGKTTSTLQHDKPTMPPKLISIETQDENYIASFQYEDGTVIKILIPRIDNGAQEAYLVKAVKQSKNPYGLNFVTLEHYC